MSDFLSLLSSFKKDVADVAADPSAAFTSENDPRASSRKRPLPTTITNPTLRPSPALPAFHLEFKKNRNSFELSFLVIGGQKCGTTWLHCLLQQCPQVSLPLHQKEVHFWDWHYRKGFDWYIRQFRDSESELSSSTSKPEKFFGEITPDYAVLHPSTISEIYRCFPNLKIVFVARDLVARAWSAMIMELRDQSMGLKPGEFAEGVIDEKERSVKKAKHVEAVALKRRLHQISSPSSQPDSYFMERLQHDTHTSRSDYATSLKNWYRHFPADSILLVDYNDIQSDPRKALYKIVSHIGVGKTEAEKYVRGLNQFDLTKRINASSKNTDTEGAEKSASESFELLLKRPVLKKRMEMYLSPCAVRFNELLRERCYSWQLNDYRKK